MYSKTVTLYSPVSGRKLFDAVKTLAGSTPNASAIEDKNGSGGQTQVLQWNVGQTSPTVSKRLAVGGDSGTHINPGNTYTTANVYFHDWGGETTDPTCDFEDVQKNIDEFASRLRQHLR